ncbi:bacterial Ig-like domain-containing protein [Lactobacillus sp. ESL0791]|nr:bacterial Ig-like domain-containing protein [Lactobacillus sp. ESL0791]MDF7638603.1 bacterial Ig-like domain-containing protein [Lactobacillus sp. ESL0791]
MFLAAGLAADFTVKETQARSYGKAVTKIAGGGNYGIYHKVSRKGPSGRFTTTRYFRHSQIQSKKYLATKQGNYWDIIIDGREVGWVNQNFFVRSKIAVAPEVSLVNNSGDNFNTRDAINYATDSQGTAVDASKVRVSKATVSAGTPGSTTIRYRYGKAKASSQVTVRASKNEGIVQANQIPKTGPKAVATWKGSSKSSSHNWNAAHNYQFETKANTFRANGLTLRTKLFQPRFFSLDYNLAADRMGQVGVIPEGITVHDKTFTVSLFSSNSSLNGHLVSYNLNRIGKFQAQNIPNMKWSTFVKCASNVKVSPYIKLGHGQSLGSSGKYIYVMANNNKNKNSGASEEIMRVRKSDLQVNKIWTFRIANGDSPRYIHNATFVGDNTMYCLFHNASRGSYEYWKVTRSGNTWTPVEVGATGSDFISNGSPVQGFTYDSNSDQFYIAFNDYIFKVAKDGTYQKTYRLHAKREIEGLSVANSKLYVEFAQRSELTQGKIN